MPINRQARSPAPLMRLCLCLINGTLPNAQVRRRLRMNVLGDPVAQVSVPVLNIWQYAQLLLNKAALKTQSVITITRVSPACTLQLTQVAHFILKNCFGFS